MAEKIACTWHQTSAVALLHFVGIAKQEVAYGQDPLVRNLMKQANGRFSGQGFYAKGIVPMVGDLLVSDLLEQMP